jgi:hypothetical protein
VGLTRVTMNAESVESTEERIVRYLELAADAIKAAATARTPETRNAYLAIAGSWMELAKGVHQRGDDS